jgi:hypothetical protein
LLEVVLAFGLAVLSVAFIAGVLFVGLLLFGPVVGTEAGGGGRLIFLGSICLSLYALKYPWTALLRYYRYEAHTLRPLKDEKTAAPANGREKNEG